MNVSSEYVADDELFEIKNDGLTEVWRKNPYLNKWGFLGSNSHVNYPYKYEDLATEQTKKYKTMGDDLTTFTKASFDKYLFSINKNSDFQSDKDKVTDLRSSTFSAAYNAINNKEITFKDLVTKYNQYHDKMVTINSGRKAGMESKILSIYTFINQKKFNEDHVSKSSKEFCMYGDIPIEERGKIFPNLFILEYTKNREGDIKSDKIIRWKADLNYNRFIEL